MDNDAHHHPPIPFLDHARSTPHGSAVDFDLLGHLLGATFDACTPCRDTLIARVADDPATTARLIGIACTCVAESFGGLPPNMLDTDTASTVPPPFRRLATAGLDGNQTGMAQAATDMLPADRATAVATALDMLVGLLTLSA